MSTWMLCTIFCIALPGDEPEHETKRGGWRLAKSPSAYLREHAENPVEWYPWGQDAFDRAQALDRPIFLSIGYSSCHWCHVMRRESFSNDSIAGFLNQNFISIKVDREDLPHVDDAYMDAVRALTGGGGWPLSVFLMPDQTPFFGGTYFPPRARFNRPGFIEVLASIDRVWREDREKVVQNAVGLTKHLEERSARVFEGIEPETYLQGGLEGAAQSYTPDPAGFGKAPRFPAPRLLQYLVGEGAMRGDQSAIDQGTSVLRAMAQGGIYDQVGGGFHRYSVDAQWQVPHFEKMLYNQGSLAESYFEVGRITRDAELYSIGRQTLEAMLRQFQLEDGSFAGSWDADSGGVEGSFYVWTPEQVDELLGEEHGPLVCAVLGIASPGNFEGGEESVPRKAMTVAAAATSLGIELELAQEWFSDGVTKMEQARSQRVAPKRDPKVVLGWNALAISALARGAALLDEPVFREAAVGAYTSLKDSLVVDDGFLRRRDGQVVGNPATLQDAALWIKCCLDLYEATFRVEFVSEAIRSWQLILRDFGPLEEGEGLHEAPEGAEVLLGRRQEFFDGAIPSGNATMARCLLRLHELTGEAQYRSHAEHIIAAGLRSIGPYPTGSAELLLAVQALTRATPAVAVVGDPAQEQTRSLLNAVIQSPIPFSVVAFRPAGKAGEKAADVISLLQDRGGEGTTQAFLCVDQVCDLPTADVEALSSRLLEIAQTLRSTAEPGEEATEEVIEEPSEKTVEEKTDSEGS
ncbi:MAG: thioredoxin domain-containing protein [Planctomycetota bacterium]|nr:thioredoxin domain-containing protein [Planctomycetota bacterium]